MNVITFFVSKVQATPVEEPVEAGLDDIAIFSRAAAVIGIALGDQWRDAALAQRFANFLFRIVSTIRPSLEARSQSDTAARSLSASGDRHLSAQRFQPSALRWACHERPSRFRSRLRTTTPVRFLGAQKTSENRHTKRNLHQHGCICGPETPRKLNVPDQPRTDGASSRSSDLFAVQFGPWQEK